MPLSSSSSVVHNMSRTLKNLILELEELGLERKDFEDLKDEQPSSESEEDELLEELSQTTNTYTTCSRNVKDY